MAPVDHMASDVPVNRLPIYVRAYAVRETKDRDDYEADPKVGPSDWTLTFDCETTVDESLRLRFGAYQLRKGGVLKRHGLFYAADLPATDLAVLTAVAAERGLDLLTVAHFIDRIFFGRLYALGGTVIGFNLPFDISRLAISHGAARKRMRGGFSFKLSTNTDWPRVRVKHISPRMAFIRFGAIPKKRTPEGQKKRGLAVPPRRGYFVDVKTLASALLAESFSLRKLSQDLGVATPKETNDDHGKPITPNYVGYCLTDVQATWECREALAARLTTYGLPAPERSLFSPASLGKSYLKAMNALPWTEVQPDFPPELTGQIMSAYFGGRAEVHIRRRCTRTLYCDFLSMYPTACTLQGLWAFVIGGPMTWRDSTAQTQAWLSKVTLADLQNPATWPTFTTLVQLKPADDVLPARGDYGDEGFANIAVNRITSDTPLWYTLADVVNSKLSTGRAPIIERAITFTPGPPQPGLCPVDIAGNPDYRVDPANEDFYRRVIDLRRSVKAARDAANDPDMKARLDGEQLALKILANATSYGIFIELVVTMLEKAEVLTVYGHDGVGYPAVSSKYEEPGAFFHPLLATLITGAARLLLGIAERLTQDQGLDWVFCDTDSLAIAKPDAMGEAEFIPRARSVCDWFKPLNPYAKKGSILQVEDVNFTAGHAGDWSAAEPLYCVAVSSKRYALFNLDDAGEPVIRKASAHGLGHLLPPYRDPDEDRAAERLREIKVDLWQEDLWLKIIREVLTGDPAHIDLKADPRLRAPQASRYAATSPDQLASFKSHNRGRDYASQVRPSNFLLRFKSEKLEQIASSDPEAWGWWRTHKRDPSPVAPFNKDPNAAAAHAFDAGSKDTAVPERWLVSYAGGLVRYHIHRETKFWGGDWRESGVLRRRHVIPKVVQHIGKEADQWEEQLRSGSEIDLPTDYGISPAHRASLVDYVRAARKRFSVRKFCKIAGVSDRTLAAAVSELPLVDNATLFKLIEAANILAEQALERAGEAAQLLEWAQRRAADEGPYAFAAGVGIDGSNLIKILAGKRELSQSMRVLLVAARTADQGPLGPPI